VHVQFLNRQLLFVFGVAAIFIFETLYQPVPGVTEPSELGFASSIK